MPSVEDQLYDETTLHAEQMFGQLFTPEGIADPHAVHAQHTGVRTEWEAIDTLLRSPKVGRAPTGGDLTVWQLFDRWPIQLDGEVHRIFRRIARGPFRRDALGQSLAVVGRTCDEMLDELEPAGEMEAIEDLFAPMAFVAIWRILDLPDEDRETVRRQVVALTEAFTSQVDPERMAELDGDVRALWDYFIDVVGKRRADPGDDLLSTLATQAADEEQLDDDTLAACALFLVHTHYEEITHGLGNSLVTLLRHPDQLQMLIGDRSLLPTAVQELVRFEPVVQPVTLRANETVEAGDWTVPAGTHFTVLLAAANRDPKVFDDPDTLDIRRDPNPHLSFSAGPHFCLGRDLATAELELILGRMLDRLPDLRLAGEAPWATAHPIRQLAALPIRWTT